MFPCPRAGRRFTEIIRQPYTPVAGLWCTNRGGLPALPGKPAHRCLDDHGRRIVQFCPVWDTSCARWRAEWRVCASERPLLGPIWTGTGRFWTPRGIIAAPWAGWRWCAPSQSGHSHLRYRLTYHRDHPCRMVPKLNLQGKDRYSASETGSATGNRAGWGPQQTSHGCLTTHRY